MWVTETAPERDPDGQEIPNSAKQCFVEMALPPGLTEAEKRNRDAILRAARRAVYEQGLTEYGNKPLTVITVADIVTNQFERVSITKLLPPDKAERVRAGLDKDVDSRVDDDSDPVSYDDEDDGDGEGSETE